MTGAVLAGRYELREVIGQGGMAVVYRALDRSLGREVAVKILREQYAADPEFVERFEREARAAARLSHPNAVDIYDIGADGAVHFIVMELVEGEDLKSLIRRRGALPPARVIALGQEVAAALEAAHRRGLVHRDVKPQNILLDADGHARLTDFGIAQAADAAGLTEAGTVLGTAQYMAPEQALGRPSGPASDVYSLGVVLYELATGQLPFQADNPVALSLRHVEEPPVPPRRLNPSVPPSLEAVILRALAKDPAARFPAAAELALALAGGPQPDRERTASYTAVAAPRRRDDRTAAWTQPRPAPAPAVGRRQPVRAAPAPVATPRPAPTRPRQGGRGAGTIVLLLMILASLGALALGFNWLFGASRPAGPVANPTAIPAFTAAPVLAVPPTATLSPTLERATPTAQVVLPTPAPPTVAASPTRAPATPTPAPAAAPAPAAVRVPKLVGLNLGEAQTEISKAGLVLQFRDEQDPRRPDGVVLEQSPKEGESVPRGSVVRLVVNRLPTVQVPNVTGLPEAEARRVLQNAGLKVKVEGTDSGRKGVVHDQAPEPGVRLAPDSEVKIWVRS